MKIVIDFYQVRFGVPEALAFIKWPQSLTFIGKYFKMLRLNTVQIAPIHCLFSNLKVGAFGRLYTILRINARTIILGFTFYGARKVLLTIKTFENQEKQAKKISETTTDGLQSNFLSSLHNLTKQLIFPLRTVLFATSKRKKL